MFSALLIQIYFLNKNSESYKNLKATLGDVMILQKTGRTKNTTDWFWFGLQVPAVSLGHGRSRAAPTAVELGRVPPTSAEGAAGPAAWVGKAGGGAGWERP